MFCKECGKLIPDGADHCSFCGAPILPSGPRHARPETDDELYSYSDRHLSDEKDSTRVFDPNRDKLDETRVYDPGAFEDNGAGYDDRYDGNDPRFDAGYDPNYDPAYVPGPMYPDDPELIGDDYENYQDGESDDTFMDRVDNRFRRDDDDPRKKKSKAWLWILLSVIAVIVIAVILVFAFSGKLFGNNKKPAPTTAPATTLATAKPKATQAPATQAPAPTQAPETQAPATEPPVVTQAPAPTQAPATQAPVTEAPPTEAPPTETPTEMN